MGELGGIFILRVKLLKYDNNNGNDCYRNYKVQHYSTVDWQEVMLCGIKYEVQSICKTVLFNKARIVFLHAFDLPKLEKPIE